MKMKRFLSVAMFVVTCTAVGAQGTVTLDQLNRASRQRQQQQERRYNTPAQSSTSTGLSTVYAEYNPTTLHYSYSGHSDNTSYQGVSVGYSYAMPSSGMFGLDLGVKGQYFWRNEDEHGYETEEEVMSATIPVNLNLSFLAANGFEVKPYAGLFGRYNFSGKVKNKTRDTEVDLFDDNDMGGHPWKRFQFGWQAGINFRISEVVTLGGGYWMDLSEITDHTKAYGFDIRLGASF